MREGTKNSPAFFPESILTNLYLNRQRRDRYNSNAISIKSLIANLSFYREGVNLKRTGC